jgi:hypothetical protein
VTSSLSSSTKESRNSSVVKISDQQQESSIFPAETATSEFQQYFTAAQRLFDPNPPCCFLISHPHFKQPVWAWKKD